MLRACVKAAPQRRLPCLIASAGPFADDGRAPHREITLGNFRVLLVARSWSMIAAYIVRLALYGGNESQEITSYKLLSEGRRHRPLSNCFNRSINARSGDGRWRLLG